MKKINKLDICVIVLALSTSLPLIFNTYVSLTGTIQTILKYILALCIYMLFRIICKKHNKVNEVISNILITITIILIFIGIDGITTGILNNLLTNIGGGVYNGENNLISLFGYSNILSTFIASVLFFNINNYLKQENKKIQAIYKTSTLIFIIGIILTYSKGTYLILPILLIPYIIIIKDKKQKIEVIENIVISSLLAIMFIISFQKLCRLECYTLAWIELIMLLLIDYAINIIMMESKKIDIKKIGIIAAIVVTLVASYIIIELNNYEDNEDYTRKIEQNYDTKNVENIFERTIQEKITITKNYPAKIILEFRLLEIIAYIGIAIILLKIFIQLIKNKNVEMLTIWFALMVVVIHSIINMNLEYIWVLVYVFGLIGILSNNVKKKAEETEKEKKITIPVILLMIGIIICSYLVINPQIYSAYNKIPKLAEEMKKLDISSDEYKEINYKIAKEYEKIIKVERYDYIEIYYNIVFCYINSNCENKKEILERYYEKILQYKNMKKSNLDKIITKMSAVDSIVTELEKQNNPQYDKIIEKFIKIILDEYSETKKEIEEVIKEQNIYETNNVYIKKLDNIYREAQLKEKYYLLGVSIINDTDINIEEENLETLNVETNKNILIYHTHGSESYKSDKKYDTYKFYRSLDENYNVIKIGNYLTELLKGKNFNVIHQTKYYDLPSTAGAYDRAKVDVKEILNKNKDISVVLDIHRDSYSEQEYEAPKIDINGEEVAKLRFVIGINKEDKNWMYDLKFAIDMQNKANEMYPGLFSPILIREREYNQDVAKHAVLIEVGENWNTIEQALNSVKYLAEVLENSLK